MKNLLLIVAFTTGSFIGRVYGQYNPSMQCGIYFDYDAVGNRVKRSYDCKNLADPWYPPASSSKMAGSDRAGKEYENQDAILVYPNPTSGAFTIRLSGVPKEPIHFHWYNDQLQILGSGHITEVIYSGDISGWADGVYILRVYEGNKVHAFKIVKVTSVGR